MSGHEHEEDDGFAARCDFCGSEESLTFVMAPGQNGTQLATSCAACAHSLSVAKDQIEKVVDYHRKRQQWLDQQSGLYGVISVVGIGIGSGLQWGPGIGVLAGSGALLIVSVLRAMQR